MSTTAAIRAYVPRPSSVPATSPNPPPKRQNFVPRATSGSKNGSPAPVSEEVRRNADAILKVSCCAARCCWRHERKRRRRARASPRLYHDSNDPALGRPSCTARQQPDNQGARDSISSLITTLIWILQGLRPRTEAQVERLGQRVGSRPRPRPLYQRSFTISTRSPSHHHLFFNLPSKACPQARAHHKRRGRSSRRLACRTRTRTRKLVFRVRHAQNIERIPITHCVATPPASQCSP